ncbi:hypothetical protein BDP27DRAFT_1433538 [Rhodocollybia butyracea]|uniref:3'-5' exonuclease domain-containing protein n=1 Tax=Rhodocollybia butyracea TaxID=206335 RepID=A0A9P5TWU1_9AGAR|nr:hypothetical protein BDP27DRAFT_1433538 [Rhodocollybia butyracea]
MVNADLRQLETLSGKGPFWGGLELGTFAKQQFLISDARISLSDLTAALLQKCLPKNQTECISTNWVDNELSKGQFDYAARDAYASLMLFHMIDSIPIPKPVTSITPSETPVIILTDDKKKVAACGVLSPPRTAISMVLMFHHGAIMKLHATGTTKPTLHDFGEVPFDMSIIIHSSALIIHPFSGTDISNSKSDEDTLGALIDSSFPQSEFMSADIESADKDEASAQISRDSLGSRDGLNPSVQVIQSRVVKDPFHVFHMIYISRTHALRILFAQALRDAMFIPHPEDKRRVLDWLKVKGLTWEFMLQYKSHWVWRHVRCTIPPAEHLYPAIHDVFSKYGPLKDAKTGLPLFSSSTWKTVKNILELARNGYLSDPPDISLHYCVGLDYQAGGL